MKPFLFFLISLMFLTPLSAQEEEIDSAEALVRFGGYFDISYPIPVGDNFLSDHSHGEYHALIGADLMGLMAVRKFYVVAMGLTVKSYKNYELDNYITFVGFQTLFGVHIPLTKRWGIVPSVMGSYGMDHLINRGLEIHERDPYVSIGGSFGPVFQVTNRLGVKGTLSYRYYYTFVDEEERNNRYNYYLHVISPRVSVILLL